MELLISVPCASLSAGLALSLLVALLLRGLTCPAEPAGVYAPSTPINRNSILNVKMEIIMEKADSTSEVDKLEVKGKEQKTRFS